MEGQFFEPTLLTTHCELNSHNFLKRKAEFYALRNLYKYMINHVYYRTNYAKQQAFYHYYR